MFWVVLDTVAVLLKIAALSKISALADTLAPAETLPVSVVMPDTTKLPVMLELPPTVRVVLILAKPVDVMPVELAMKLEPTVSEAELTLVLTFAKPVIVVLPEANVVMPETAPVNVPVVADILLAIVNPPIFPVAVGKS